MSKEYDNMPLLGEGIVADKWREAILKDPEILKRLGMKKHEHQFVIPVEWEYYYVTRDFNTFNGKRVTKLRCACGEETKR